MQKGKKPAAVEAKKLAGVHPCRIPNTPEIETAPDVMIPPEYLDDVAVKKWNELYPVLQECGILKISDIDILAGYCYAYSQFYAAQQEVKSLPIVTLDYINQAGEKQKHSMKFVYRTWGGKVQAAPCVMMAKHWLEIAHKLMAELGMTPSARGRLNVAPQNKKKDKLMAFLNKNVKKKNNPMPNPGGN